MTGASDESTDPITDTDNDSKAPKQWSHWSNVLYAIRICGFPVVATIIMTVLFDKISETVLDMYKLDVLKGNSNSSKSDSNAMLTYIGMTTLSDISSSLMWELKFYIRNALINAKFDQKVGNHLIRGLLFAPLTYFESKQGSDIYDAYNDAIRIFASRVHYYLTYRIGHAISALLLIYRIVKSSPWLLICLPLFWWVDHMEESTFEPLNKNIEDLQKKEKKEHNHNQNLAKNGAQMIRLFGVEPYFTNNYIQSAESTTRLGMIISTYDDLNDVVSATVKTALHSIVLYAYIAMSKIGLYMIRAGDVAGFRQNCESISRNITAISSLLKDTFKLLAEINEFRNLAERDPEAPYIIDTCRPSAQWPPNGKIEFRNFSMKYGADLGYALKNVNLTINPGEKIGIVGRTGAGKSSLAKVLFRLVHENTS
ncbi:hypothetical protein GGF41_006314, partial [Coemansia sp. RSA 2531]